MDPNTSPVKPTRRYDSVRRREQARQTRETILNTAQRLFLTDGFATTTIAAIAQGAHVSVDTIYKSFGGKAGLVGRRRFPTPEPATRRNPVRNKKRICTGGRRPRRLD